MDYFAGLDVSVKDTNVCIVDDTGKIIREVKVASEPDALLQVLRNATYRFKRIGLEAGPLSQWLFSALGEANLPVICVETRHMRAVLQAQINKTDRNDARGIAQMMRVGLYRPVHVKTLRSQKLRMLLTHRKLLQYATLVSRWAWRARPNLKAATRSSSRNGATLVTTLASVSASRMALPRWERSDLKAGETMPLLGRSRTSRPAFATKPSPVKSSSAHESGRLLRRP